MAPCANAQGPLEVLSDEKDATAETNSFVQITFPDDGEPLQDSLPGAGACGVRMERLHPGMDAAGFYTQQPCSLALLVPAVPHFQLESADNVSLSFSLMSLLLSFFFLVVLQ